MASVMYEISKNGIELELKLMDTSEAWQAFLKQLK